MHLGSSHAEHHVGGRVGWLRAAVLGANDGIVSTASLILGVAAADVARNSIFVAAVAGLVAGAMSMAAGEYVSVSSQSDAERADMAIERRELQDRPDVELQELARIYVGRGLDAGLADRVARQLTSRDALAAHVRDELGMTEVTAARPVQAALASAAAFTVGAAMPLLTVVLAPSDVLIAAVVVVSLVVLALLGAFGARAGGASVPRAIARVTFWGASAMALTAAIGALVGTTV